jgi:hypothetical protein
MAETAKTAVPMNYSNLLSDDDVTKDWEKREDSRKRGFTINDKEWNMVDFEAVRKISDSCTSFVCMCNYDNLVPSINQLLRRGLDE